MAARSAEREIVPELDFRDIIGINVCFLQWLGIIMPDVKSTVHAGWYILRAGAIFVLTSMLVSEVMNVVMIIGDLEKMAEGSFMTLSLVTYGYKVYTVYKYENKVTSLINSLNRRVFQPKNMNQYYSLKSHIYESKIVSKLFLSAGVCTCGFLAISPFTEEGDILPLAGWFPFDITYSPTFEIVYVYQAVSIVILGISDISLDTFMSGLIMAVCAQLNMLNDSLKNIREYAEIELNDNGAQEVRVIRGISPQLQSKMDEKLIQCVVHHRYILEFADEVKCLFTNSILGQFFISVVIICVTLFEMMILPWTSIKFFSVVLYQFCMLLEIFLLCYYGNKVIMESMELAKFAYCSDWIDCSKEYKHNLLFFMTRSQRELRLSIGGFFTLSLETFVKILKSSWSCFALLSTIYTEEE